MAEKTLKAWLLGSVVSELPKSKLPTIGSILKVFLSISPTTSPKSASILASDVLHIWFSCGIPCIEKDKVCLKIKNIHAEYQELQRSKHRRTELQESRENNFNKKCGKLCDIAKSGIDSLVSDKVNFFLRNQRTTRTLKLNFLKDEAPYTEERRCHKKIVNTDVSEANDFERDGSEEDMEYTENYSPKIKNLETSNSSVIVNTIIKAPEVTSTIDRIKLSSNKFKYLMGSIGKVLTADSSKSRVSKNTIERRRKQNRSIIARNIKSEFIETSASEVCVIHWDGKLLTNIQRNDGTVKKKVDRIAVAATSSGNSKLLGIPKVNGGTGDNIAKVVFEEITDWNLTRVIGICFDTTKSNTGGKIGAASLLQKKYLKQQILHFPCRHHICEIILAAVFIYTYGVSSGPNITTFVDFRNRWNEIPNKSTYIGIPENKLQSPLAKQLRLETVECLQQILSDDNSYTPRDDYRELIDLTLIILGVQNKKYKIRIPGALHHARWMCKVIYAFKMYLLREQHQFSEGLQKSLQDFCLFCSLMYVKYWILCPLFPDAAVNDLTFYKNLKSYEEIDKNIAQCAQKSLKIISGT
ncbi:hypothetical protein Bhyg_13217 [Pseudolycoriella hygida]|uniref:Uncharacterized protein n=1 Tax=Pseudolycoriella hygida TaxID=35572 RepID=A0A9Q0MMY2_9DIPT|nr:hypothetical protein Bhyg_13217 [Pseudolycoriella hygida]